MERINEDIKNKDFRQFYLLMGEEGYLKNQYRGNLSSAIIDLDDTMNYFYIEGKNLNLSEVFEVGETLPFFSERRLLVLENTGLFKKSVDGIEEHFEKFPDTTVVIMVEEEVDKRNRLYKWFGKHGYIAQLSTPDEKMLVAWIKKLCAREEKTMDESAIFYLIEHMGTEMFLLKNELEKLFSYTVDKKHITIAEINEVCLDEAEDKMFDMLDAIGNRNQKKALHLYRDLLELRKPAMQILALLNRHYNILLQISGLQDAGTDNKTIASLCGIPPFTVKKYINQSSAYTYNQLKEMLEKCQITDAEIKSGIIKDIVGVELLIVEFSK